MNTLDEAKKKAATTYNAASDFYDHPTNTFLGTLRPADCGALATHLTIGGQ